MTTTMDTTDSPRRTGSGADDRMSDRPIDLAVTGMTCAACVGRVERALQDVGGVDRASVNLTTGKARVWADDDVETTALVAAVRNSGYEAAPADKRRDDHAERNGSLREQRQAIILAFGLGLPIIVLHFLAHRLVSSLPGGHFWPHAIQLALLLMLFRSPAGAPILLSGIRSALHGVGTMDVLIAIGVLTAGISSAVGMFLPNGTAFIHYHAAAMILIFINVGRYLEARARSRTTDAVSELSRRVPTSARRVTPDGVETVPLDEIGVGDRVRVAEDEDVPVDGEIVDGSGTLDESTITGESAPVERAKGDRVFAGTRVTGGLLTLTATSPGTDTTVTRIIRAVEDAQAGKTEMQRLADRVAGVFVPIIVAVAVVTLVGWIIASGGAAGIAPGLRAAIAVLVVACPCALGLATPTAVAVATGEAARRGILVREPAALETAGLVDTLVFDKTGTLTTGEFGVTAIDTIGGITEDELLELAAAAETNASHGIATAIVAEAKSRSLRIADVDSFEPRVGMGVEATIADRRVVVGSRRFMEQSDIDVTPADHVIERTLNDGGAPVLVAVDGSIAGVIGVADKVRDGSAEAVRRLRSAGIDVAMVTGDGLRVAEAVAEKVGIDDITAEVTPLGKVEDVQRRQAAGRRVAFVGDGTNDAPALATADVGVAFAAGTDAANAAAGVSLVSDAVRLVSEVLRISRLSRRVIKQNLFWAFVYNVVAVPLAAFNVLPPAYAAAAMMMSSISVVLNALRLGRLVRRTPA